MKRWLVIVLSIIGLAVGWTLSASGVFGGWAEATKLRGQLVAEQMQHAADLREYAALLNKANAAHDADKATLAEITARVSTAEAVLGPAAASAKETTAALNECVALNAHHRKQIAATRTLQEDVAEHWRKKFLEQVNENARLVAALRGAQ